MIELENKKRDLCAEIDRRVEDKILESTNGELLKKLINNAEDLNEAISIASLGTMYKRTGLHYDVRLEKSHDNNIRYFKKNQSLSFHQDDSKPTHKLIIGDNYEALQNLLIEYKHRVDVIYIDPPYGKDSMGDFADTNYDNAITRDNLLSMLHPRLILAKQLLTEEGTIFCSIDDKNHAYVKCLFDEVFGESNFEGQIHWRRRHNQPNDKTKLIGIVAEHILAYSKNREVHKNFGIGKVGLTGKFTNPDNDPRGPWLSNPWKAAKGRGGTKYELVTPAGIVYNETWYGSKKTFEQHVADNRVLWTKGGEGIPRIKVYKYEAEEQGQCATNWWPNDKFGCNQDATDELKSIFEGICPFENPKPTSLIKSLIQLGTIKENAIILDFFAGSATTGHASLLCNKEGLNFEFVMCQINEITDENPHGIALDVTSPRLKRIMTGSCYNKSEKYPFYTGCNDFSWIKDNEPYGGNLDVYEIASVPDFETTPGRTAFDVIDETLYGKHFDTMEEKVKWVCDNFKRTETTLKQKK